MPTYQVAFVLESALEFVVLHTAGSGGPSTPEAQVEVFERVQFVA